LEALRDGSKQCCSDGCDRTRAASQYFWRICFRVANSIYTHIPSADYFPLDKPLWYRRDAARETFANATLFPMTAFDTYFRSLVPEGPRALNELFNKDGMGLSVDPNRFANVPKVVITGDQDPRHTRAVDQKLARFLGAEFIYLGDVGMPGHGHMMMLDKDNQKIAQLIIDWLGKKGL